MILHPQMGHPFCCFWGLHPIKAIVCMSGLCGDCGWSPPQDSGAARTRGETGKGCGSRSVTLRLNIARRHYIVWSFLGRGHRPQTVQGFFKAQGLGLEVWSVRFGNQGFRVQGSGRWGLPRNLQGLGSPAGPCERLNHLTASGHVGMTSPCTLNLQFPPALPTTRMFTSSCKSCFVRRVPLVYHAKLQVSHFDMSRPIFVDFRVYLTRNLQF